MDAADFTNWTRALADTAKPSLAKQIAAKRGDMDEQADRFLREARSAAEAATADAPDFDSQWNAVSASSAPADFLDDNRDMEAWNRQTGDHLREAFQDALLALAAGSKLGKGQRKVLAKPLLPEVSGLAEALGLA